MAGTKVEIVEIDTRMHERTPLSPGIKQQGTSITIHNNPTFSPEDECQEETSDVTSQRGDTPRGSSFDYGFSPSQVSDSDSATGLFVSTVKDYPNSSVRCLTWKKLLTAICLVTLCLAAGLAAKKVADFFRDDSGEKPLCNDVCSVKTNGSAGVLECFELDDIDYVCFGRTGDSIRVFAPPKGKKVLCIRSNRNEITSVLVAGENGSCPNRIPVEVADEKRELLDRTTPGPKCVGKTCSVPWCWISCIPQYPNSATSGSWNWKDLTIFGKLHGVVFSDKPLHYRYFNNSATGVDGYIATNIQSMTSDINVRMRSVVKVVENKHVRVVEAIKEEECNMKAEAPCP